MNPSFASSGESGRFRGRGEGGDGWGGRIL